MLHLATAALLITPLVAPLGASESRAGASCPATAIHARSTGAALIQMHSTLGEQKATKELASTETEAAAEVSILETPVKSIIDIYTEDCPDWCLHRRFEKFGWATKCWTSKCQGCRAWQENCADVLKGERPKLCERWCKHHLKNNLQQRDAMMCKWVKCQGCEEFVEKCSRAKEAAEEGSEADEEADAAEELAGTETEVAAAEVADIKEGNVVTEQAEEEGANTEASTKPDTEAGDTEIEEKAEMEDCPDWCLHRRFEKFGWATKCWTSRCQGCPAWQKNCADVLKGERPKLCTHWCKHHLKNNLQQRDAMMCKWVKCRAARSFWRSAPGRRSRLCDDCIKAGAGLDKVSASHKDPWKSFR